MTLQNEFPRILQTLDVDTRGKNLSYEATPVECINIALRFNVPTIKFFKIEATLKKTSHTIFSFEATLTADVTLHDALTNEAFVQKVNNKVAFTLTTQPVFSKEKDMNEPEVLELEADGSIDIGEILVQYLSLSLDPYPKATRS